MYGGAEAAENARELSEPNARMGVSRGGCPTLLFKKTYLLASFVKKFDHSDVVDCGQDLLVEVV